MSIHYQHIKYTKEHEWAYLENNIITIGITQFAADQLGDIVFVELPKPSTKVTIGTTFGTVESVKSVSDLYAPISGTVLEVNTILVESPQAVNEDPYGMGWMLRLQPDNPAEMDLLMSFNEYKALLDTAL